MEIRKKRKNNSHFAQVELNHLCFFRVGLPSGAGGTTVIPGAPPILNEGLGKTTSNPLQGDSTNLSINKTSSPLISGLGDEIISAHGKYFVEVSFGEKKYYREASKEEIINYKAESRWFGRTSSDPRLLILDKSPEISTASVADQLVKRLQGVQISIKSNKIVVNGKENTIGKLALGGGRILVFKDGTFELQLDDGRFAKLPDGSTVVPGVNGTVITPINGGTEGRTIDEYLKVNTSEVTHINRPAKETLLIGDPNKFKTIEIALGEQVVIDDEGTWIVGPNGQKTKVEKGTVIKITPDTSILVDNEGKVFTSDKKYFGIQQIQANPGNPITLNPSKIAEREKIMEDGKDRLALVGKSAARITAERLEDINQRIQEGIKSLQGKNTDLRTQIVASFNSIFSDVQSYSGVNLSDLSTEELRKREQDVSRKLAEHKEHLETWTGGPYEKNSITFGREIPDWRSSNETERELHEARSKALEAYHDLIGELEIILGRIQSELNIDSRQGQLSLGLNDYTVSVQGGFEIRGSVASKKIQAGDKAFYIKINAGTQEDGRKTMTVECSGDMTSDAKLITYALESAQEEKSVVESIKRGEEPSNIPKDNIITKESKGGLVAQSYAYDDTDYVVNVLSVPVFGGGTVKIILNEAEKRKVANLLTKQTKN